MKVRCTWENEELRNKIRDLIRSITKNSHDDLSLKRMLEFHNMLMVVRSVFHEDNKYYWQIFLYECLHKLEMLEYDWIDVFEGIDVIKNKESLGYTTCNYYCFIKEEWKKF